MDGRRIKCSAVVRSAAAKGGDLAFAVAANEARGNKNFSIILDGFCNEFVCLGNVVLDDEFTGVKPLNNVAFRLKFQGQDCGGKDLSKRHLFLLRGGFQVCKNGVDPCLYLLALLAGKKAVDDVSVAFLHVLDILRRAGEQCVRASADCGAHEDHLALQRLRLNNVQHPGHRRRICHGGPAEFEYTILHVTKIAKKRDSPVKPANDVGGAGE